MYDLWHCRRAVGRPSYIRKVTKMNTTTMAISGTALVLAADANHTAHEAKKLSCLSLEKTFDAKTSNIEEKQDYAECINTLYPANTILIGQEVAILLLVMFLISVFRGVYAAIQDSWADSLSEKLLCFVISSFLTFVGLLTFSMVSYGVIELVTIATGG